MKEFALLQDKTSKMYYIGYVPAIKSRENLEVIEKYTDEREAMEDLVNYSTGRKVGGVGARLTLKDVAEDLIPGGKADNESDSNFDKEQLKAGIKVEMEHTDDPEEAKEIAKDHLSEDPNYYKKLRKVHKDE